MIFLLVSLPVAAQTEAEPPAVAPPAACPDAVVSDVAVRLEERATNAERLAGWEEFERLYPDHPCLQWVRARIEQLRADERTAQESRQKAAWQQEARGGLIEPERRELPELWLGRAAAPRSGLLLETEVVLLDPDAARRSGLSRAVWTQRLAGEWAPLAWLVFSLDLPAVAGELQDEGFLWALGNIVLGLRGVWGRRLGEAGWPLVVSGGLLWSSASTTWSGRSREDLLNATSFAAGHRRLFFRFDDRAIVMHLEAQFGMGEHFWGLGLDHHLTVGGERVERLTRLDLSYTWRFMADWEAALEAVSVFGDAEQDIFLASNESLVSFFLSPVLRWRIGSLALGMALRVPLGDAAEWAQLALGLSLLWRPLTAE